MEFDFMGKGWKYRKYIYRRPTFLQVVFFIVLVYFLSSRSVWTPQEQESTPSVDYAVYDAGLKFTPIPRIKVTDDVSYEEFWKLSAHNPVIIEGAVKHHPAFSFSFEALKNLAPPSLMIETATFSNRSLGGGGQTDNPEESWRGYIDDMLLHKTPGSPLRYAYGISIPFQLMGYYTTMLVNKFQTFDIHDVIYFPNMFMGYYFTFLFMGPKGTRTEIHLDVDKRSNGVNHYIGRKRYRAIDFNEAYKYFGKIVNGGRIERLVNSSTKGVEKKPLNIFTPDLETFPELAEMTIYEGITNGGDYIYFPPGLAHSIYNEEDSLAVAYKTLSLPHSELYLNVIEKIAQNREKYEFFRHAGCLKEGDKFDPKKLKKSDFISCFESSPSVKELRKKLKTMKSEDLKDKPFHEAYGYKSFEELCTMFNIVWSYGKNAEVFFPLKQYLKQTNRISQEQTSACKHLETNFKYFTKV